MNSRSYCADFTSVELGKEFDTSVARRFRMMAML